MNTDWPKISIITVCFNAAHLLEKTIQSVLDQTYPNLEYIIIDGASNDNTGDTVSSYGDRINKFISEPDSGIYDAMNKGIQNASGDMIIFLNAGDYYVSKDVIDFCISKMNFEKADLFFGRFIWNDPRTKDICLSDHEWVTYTWDLKESNFPHPATFYKRHLFERLGLFDTSYKLCADYEWNLRALISNNVAYQYIDIIMTVFFAEGLSNQLTTSGIKKQETERVFATHLKPVWIYKLGFRHKSSNRHTYQKGIAKTFDCKLNRIL